MKKIVSPLMFIVFVLMSFKGNAQACISPTSGVPLGGPAAGGFDDPNTTPCVVQGVGYSHDIQFTMYSSFDFLGHQNVDSIEFLSIDNLPCGLCWGVDQLDKRYTANEDGFLRIQGTTSDAVGQYKLALTLKVWINGGTTAQTIPANLVDQTGIRVFLRVKTSAGSCPSVDTSASATNLTASVACSPSVSVSLGSNQTTCNGSFVTLNPSVSGGTPNYTYAWSYTGNSLSCNNCQNPTATITQTSTYTVTVTDANSATASASVSYTVGSGNYQVTANGPTTFCQGGSVVLNAGSGYTTYHWSNNATSSTITVTQSATYSVTVTNSSGCTFTGSQLVTVNTPTITNYQITANGATSFCNGGSVVLNAGGSFTSYSWSNGSTSQTITVSQTGTYSVTVHGTDGCIYNDNQSVNTNTTFTGQTVCIVSVDQATGKNTVVWEKTGGLGIDSFKVYRETSITGVYQLIRQQPFGNFSTYTDGQSNPQQSSDRYVVTVVDACGESPYSAAHRTIHLTSNVGINNEVNLIWNAYEGFTYPSFNIYRGSSLLNMQLLTQVSSGTFSYTDLIPPAPPLYYEIEVVNPQGCVPTAKTDDYSSSLSNIIQLNALSIEENKPDIISVYSYVNDANGQTVLHINFSKQPSGSLKVYDVSGREVFAVDNVITTEIQLPNTLSKGVYIADVNTGSYNMKSKISVK